MNIKGIERQRQLMESAQRQTATKPDARNFPGGETRRKRERERERERNKGTKGDGQGRGIKIQRETERQRGIVG